MPRFRNKAVADGAVSFYLDHYVSARISKDTYGIECITNYISANAEQRVRSNATYRNAAGDLVVPKMFSPILMKVRDPNFVHSRMKWTLFKGYSCIGDQRVSEGLLAL
jgi:hypothetical protein